MGKDYYGTLELKKTADSEEIAKAFRRLALKNHPLKNPTEMNVSTNRFHEICEAYEVLSNETRRSIYDSYGYQALLEGLPDGKGGYKGGFKYQFNSFEVFEKFFANHNPYHEIFDDNGKELYGSLFGSAHGAFHQK